MNLESEINFGGKVPGRGWAEGYQHIDQTEKGLERDRELGLRWAFGIAGALTTYGLGHLGVDSRVPLQAAAFAATVKIAEDPTDPDSKRSHFARRLNTARKNFPYFLVGAGVGAMGIGLEATATPAVDSDQTDKHDNLVRVTNPAQTDGTQLQCEPVEEHGLGTTGGIPLELQTRLTCVAEDGTTKPVVLFCDKVLNSALAMLDGNSTDHSPVCYEGPSADININGARDYNPIIPDVGAINGLQAPVEAMPTTPPPPDPAQTPEPSPGEAIALLAVTTFFLLFGGRLNARRNYEAGLEDGATHGSQTDQDAESYAKKATGKDFKKAKEYYLRTHGVGRRPSVFERLFGLRK